MKMRLQSEYGGALDFLVVPVRCPDCDETRYIKLGFGSDGTMWVDPAELGIGPQHAAQLEGFGEPYLLINPGAREVLINARAVVKVLTEPERCRQWLAFVEEMLQKHKEVRARYESTRNN
jgi:hypothetical protein